MIENIESKTEKVKYSNHELSKHMVRTYIMSASTSEERKVWVDLLNECFGNKFKKSKKVVSDDMSKKKKK